MALIYRALVGVEGEGFVDAAPALLRDWLRRKLRLPQLELPDGYETAHLSDDLEIAHRAAANDGYAGFRGTLFESREGEQLRTTFTALSDGARRWAWIDLERWAEDAYAASWVPYAPGIVNQVLRDWRCRSGSSVLSTDHRAVEGDAGLDLAREVRDPKRTTPVVVVSPTRQERDEDLAPARELQRRLAGVAPVALLGPGAVSAFSRTMLQVGPDLDVHSGSVRTYLPRVGQAEDRPSRHRYVPFHRLAGRPADMARRAAR